MFNQNLNSSVEWLSVFHCSFTVRDEKNGCFLKKRAQCKRRSRYTLESPLSFCEDRLQVL